MEWLDSLWNVMVTDTAWSLITLAVGAVMGFIWRFLAKKGVEAQTVDTLRNAVATVGEDFVVWRKRAADDGKLTSDERAEARTLAVAKAKELATGPVLRLLLKWGEGRISALINRIVQGSKA